MGGDLRRGTWAILALFGGGSLVAFLFRGIEAIGPIVGVASLLLTIAALAALAPRWSPRAPRH